MTQQQSDQRVVAQSRRKSAVNQRQVGGAKALTVAKKTEQFSFGFGIAENQSVKTPRTDGEAVSPLRVSATRAGPQSKRKRKRAMSATVEEVVKSLDEAFSKIASNKGACGPDGQNIVEVRNHWAKILPQLSTALLNGNYAPGNIRRVWIAKAGGGERGLGIPNVVDRVVQEAVRMVLEPQYEPHFHDSSHGFRPGRSCHTALREAQKHIGDGYGWVVDLDLEKFFDQVNHQRLLSRLSQRVHDKRLLVLINKMLRVSVVLPNGVCVSTAEGVPQGGPLSPLLSNIVLDELDQELSGRGHRFVRYADDQNIYVKSERAGHRVMASIRRFIEKRLRLKINVEKSGVSLPEERHFLGFRLRFDALEDKVEVLLSKRTKERIDAKIRELTPRNWGGSLKSKIAQINSYFGGWIEYFGCCTSKVESTLSGLDAHLRRRLRAIQLQHWKRKLIRAHKLIGLGIRPKTAWRLLYDGRKSIWQLSHAPAVERALRNAYFAERGLVSLKESWRKKFEATVVLEQLTLFAR